MRILPVSLLVLFLFFVAQPAAAAVSAAERVVLVSNEYVPYVNTSSQSRGLLTEIVMAAFEAVDVEVVIQFRPWRRCALLVEQGEVFGAYPYAVTYKRKGYATFSDEIWRCRNVFFYMRGRYPGYDFTSLESMRGMSIAGTSGNYYEDIFEKAGLNVDYAPGEASGVRKIWEMRRDLFAEDELVGWNLIARIFPQKVHMFASTPTAWNNNSQRVMVSKRYPGAKRLLARFNEGLRIIRENGVYQRLVDQYMPLLPGLGR